MIAVLLLIASAVADQWAIIAVGSSEYINYRHHADACHAYHLLVRNGLSPDKIILMMSGDVPYSTQNPYYGELFNRPTSSEKSDVFSDCQATYLGQVVTKQLFMAVLTGDESAARKLIGKERAPVLKSTAEDTVFINFVDHGGVFLIAFPFGHVLHAKELYATMHTMRQKKMYKQVLFYVEACESGTMFNDASKIPSGILALTAANETSSFAMYCPPNDKVLQKDMHTCLGDEFSVNWMENSDMAPKNETIYQQFELVGKETRGSKVCSWGDKSIEQEMIQTFIGMPPADGAPFSQKTDRSQLHSISSRDVPLVIATYHYERAVDSDKEEWAKEMKHVKYHRQTVQTRFDMIARLACANDANCMKEVTDAEAGIGQMDLDCHFELVAEMEPCGWDYYSMKYSRVLAHLCKRYETDHLKKIVASACTTAKISSMII